MWVYSWKETRKLKTSSWLLATQQQYFLNCLTFILWNENQLKSCCCCCCCCCFFNWIPLELDKADFRFTLSRSDSRNPLTAGLHATICRSNVLARHYRNMNRTCLLPPDSMSFHWECRPDIKKTEGNRFLLGRFHFHKSAVNQRQDLRSPPKISPMYCRKAKPCYQETILRVHFD